MPEGRHSAMSFRNDQSATIGFIAAGLGGLILALGGAAYAWDGAFFLEEIINRGAPFAPQHRWSDYVWEAPTWAAIRLTDNAALAQWTSVLDRSTPAHSVGRELAHRPSKAPRPDRVANHRDLRLFPSR